MKVYDFDPQPDITAYELAQIVRSPFFDGKRRLRRGNPMATPSPPLSFLRLHHAIDTALKEPSDAPRS